jgi:hypothetical protein
MDTVHSYVSGSVVSISLTWEQLKAITQDYGNSDGGFQRLFQRLCSGVQIVSGVGPYLMMHPDDARRVVRYARQYGRGGWQDALGAIADDVEQAMAGSAADDLPAEGE